MGAAKTIPLSAAVAAATAADTTTTSTATDKANSAPARRSARPEPFLKRDTLALSEHLTEKGKFTLPQAKTLINVAVELIDEPDLATTSDVNKAVDAAKADIKELKGEVHELKVDINKINTRIDEVKGEVLELKGEVKELKAEVHELKGEVKDVKGDIKDLRKEMESNNTILRKEIELSEARTGEKISALKVDIAAIRTEIATVRVEMSALANRVVIMLGGSFALVMAISTLVQRFWK